MTNLLIRVIIILLAIIVVIATSLYAYLQQPQFVNPVLNATNLAPNGAIYDGGRFINLEPTEVDTAQKKSSAVEGFYNFMFKNIPGAKPEFSLPSKKTDLHALSPEQDVIVWLGHSSYFIQLAGKRLLIDPVFSENASPVPHTNVTFLGSNIYQADDMPDIDYLLITHDHWDHLDYPTIKSLQPKVEKVITPLGVGSYFTQWGYEPERVFSGDWHSQFTTPELTIHILPARHFSGRMLKRNQTLWASYAIISAEKKYYISGDTGYGQHFNAIGKQFGHFDVAILECGQYNQDWANIHMFPEQVAQAALDLNASSIMGSHNSKFKLARHTWRDPLERLAIASQGMPYRLLTPMIGEMVSLDNANQTFSQWWKTLNGGHH